VKVVPEAKLRLLFCAGTRDDAMDDRQPQPVPSRLIGGEKRLEKKGSAYPDAFARVCDADQDLLSGRDRLVRCQDAIFLHGIDGVMTMLTTPAAVPRIDENMRQLGIPITYGSDILEDCLIFEQQ